MSSNVNLFTTTELNFVYTSVSNILRQLPIIYIFLFRPDHIMLFSKFNFVILLSTSLSSYLEVVFYTSKLSINLLIKPYAAVHLQLTTFSKNKNNPMTDNRNNKKQLSDFTLEISQHQIRKKN
jgi:hypothetical protein